MAAVVADDKQIDTKKNNVVRSGFISEETKSTWRKQGYILHFGWMKI